MSHVQRCTQNKNINQIKNKMAIVVCKNFSPSCKNHTRKQLNHEYVTCSLTCLKRICGLNCQIEKNVKLAELRRAVVAKICLCEVGSSAIMAQ